MEVMEEEAQELLSYFNHRNVDALLKLTRNTLEMLRKRIHTSSLMHFLGGSFVTLLLSYVAALNSLAYRQIKHKKIPVYFM